MKFRPMLIAAIAISIAAGTVTFAQDREQDPRAFFDRVNSRHAGN